MFAWLRAWFRRILGLFNKTPTPADYDKLYRGFAKKAARLGSVDIETLFKWADAGGLPRAALQERLLRDVDEGGPIFGKFVRSLSGAASGSVLTAQQQGEDVAQAFEEELISLAEMEDAMDDADPEAMAEIATELEDRVMEIWIAELVNTCENCLPLHGKIMTRADWHKSGYDPKTIHVGNSRPCQCQLIRCDRTKSRDELVSPLMRVKDSLKIPHAKSITRAVVQWDLGKSLRARDDALQSEGGRRILHLLGQANRPKP